MTQPNRIKLARLSSATTLRGLSKFLSDRGISLSHAALHKYEAGTARPSPRVLMVIAEALKVRPDYLIREPAIEITWLAFRRHSRLTKAQAEQVKASVVPTIEHHLHLQRLLAGDVRPAFAKVGHVRSAEDAEDIAESVRRRWKLGEAPVVSVAETIEAHGGVVVSLKAPSPRFGGLSGLADNRLPVIVVNGSAPADRKRYSMAHELGHLVMACDGVARTEQEPLAHRFAAAFLVPRAVALRELGEKRRNLDLGELLQLKARHGLSVQAWICRARDLGIISQPTYGRMFREVGRRGWRRHEPDVFVGKEEPTRLRQMVLRALAENLISPHRAEELLPGSTESVDPAPRSPSLARQLLYSPPELRDEVLQSAAAEMVSEYRPGGALSDFDSFEMDLDDHAEE